jgi:hypothetical protein
MLSKCANPVCGRLFLYLHEGKLFWRRMSLEPKASAGEWFWLCDECLKEMSTTLTAAGPGYPAIDSFLDQNHNARRHTAS